MMLAQRQNCMYKVVVNAPATGPDKWRPNMRPVADNDNVVGYKWRAAGNGVICAGITIYYCRDTIVMDDTAGDKRR